MRSPAAVFNSRRRLQRGLRAVSRWSWPFALAVVALYLYRLLRFIAHETAFPYYDSYDYLTKTWDIATRFAHASIAERLDLNLYLNAWPPARPPLLLAIAALLLGSHSSPQAVAVVWAIVRVAAIVVALVILSRELRTARFVPAAALVIFSTPVMCNFDRIYMMDEPFGALGLLTFALFIVDDRRATFGSATAAAAAILALFLVKPVAPAFLFPLVLIRGLRALAPFARRGAARLAYARQFVPWLIPYLLLAAAFLWLVFASPYGPAIREQYQLGQAGYWRRTLTPGLARTLAGFLIPPWLLLALLGIAPAARRWKNRPTLLYATALLFWWLVFSFLLTYTVEDRLLGQAMPAVVTGLLVFLCGRPTPAFLLTVLATVVFTYNTLAATGHAPLRPNRTPAHLVQVLSPTPGHLRPTPEVGLTPVATRLLATIPTAPPPADPTHILGLFGDNYVEPNSLNLAVRAANHNSPPPLTVDWAVIDPAYFSVASLVSGHRWFLTKTARRHPPGNPTLWATIDAYHDLLTDPASPLRPYLRRHFASPLRTPAGPDELVLWEIPKTPPPDAIIAALQWIHPRFATDPRAPVIEREIATLSPGAQLK